MRTLINTHSELGEPHENLDQNTLGTWGTPSELYENTLGTSTPSPPPPPPKFAYDIPVFFNTPVHYAQGTH
jgi:hypothetical protein